jgi:signal transduction histidine kinase
MQENEKNRFNKTKQQLTSELIPLRRRIAEREASEAENKEIRDQLGHSQERVALEQLARGIEHELRNSLGAIKNATYFLNMALEEPEPEAKEALNILEKNVTRSEEIVSSLLVFIHTQASYLAQTEYRRHRQKCTISDRCAKEH